MPSPGRSQASAPPAKARRIVLLPSSTSDCATDGSKYTRMGRMGLPTLCRINELNTGDPTSNGQWKHGILARLAVWMLGFPYDEKYINYANELCKTTTGSLKKRATKKAGRDLGKSVRGDYLFLLMHCKFPDATKNAIGTRIRYRDETAFSTHEEQNDDDDHQDDQDDENDDDEDDDDDDDDNDDEDEDERPEDSGVLGKNIRAGRKQDTIRETIVVDLDVAGNQKGKSFTANQHKRMYSSSKRRTNNFPRNRQRISDDPRQDQDVTEALLDEDNEGNPDLVRHGGLDSRRPSRRTQSLEDIDGNEPDYASNGNHTDEDDLAGPPEEITKLLQGLASYSTAIPHPDHSKAYDEDEICDHLEAALARVGTTQNVMDKMTARCHDLEQKLEQAEKAKGIAMEYYLDAVDAEKAWADEAEKLRVDSA